MLHDDKEVGWANARFSTMPPWINCVYRNNNCDPAEISSKSQPEHIFVYQRTDEIRANLLNPAAKHKAKCAVLGQEMALSCFLCHLLPICSFLN